MSAIFREMVNPERPAMGTERAVAPADRAEMIDAGLLIREGRNHLVQTGKLFDHDRPSIATTASPDFRSGSSTYINPNLTTTQLGAGGARDGGYPMRSRRLRNRRPLPRAGPLAAPAGAKAESDIFHLQYGRGICPGSAAGVGILSEVDPVCRHDLP